MTIGIDLGDVWSTLNEVGWRWSRPSPTTPKGVEKWFIDLPPARIAMEAGMHSIWISEQLQELGHQVIVANVRVLLRGSRLRSFMFTRCDDIVFR